MSETETASGESPPVAERLIKEAVGVGLDTSLREPILEAVDEAEGTSGSARRKLPAASALVGVGAALGYLLGRSDLPETVPDAEAGTMLEERVAAVRDTDDEGTETAQDPLDEGTAMAEDTEDEPESDSSDDSGGVLTRAVVLLGLIAAGALVWRRRQSTDEEWEPVEEFEPATESSFTDEATESFEPTADDGEDTGEADDEEQTTDSEGPAADN